MSESDSPKSPRRNWRAYTRDIPKAQTNFEERLRGIEVDIENGTLWNARDLGQVLNMMPASLNVRVQSCWAGQYNLAKARKRRTVQTEMREQARIIQPDNWIEACMEGKPTRPKHTVPITTRPSMQRDFRVLRGDRVQVRRYNAAARDFPALPSREGQGQSSGSRAGEVGPTGPDSVPVISSTDMQTSPHRKRVSPTGLDHNDNIVGKTEADKEISSDQQAAADASRVIAEIEATLLEAGMNVEPPQPSVLSSPVVVRRSESTARCTDEPRCVESDTCRSVTVTNPVRKLTTGSERISKSLKRLPSPMRDPKSPKKTKTDEARFKSEPRCSGSLCPVQGCGQRTKNMNRHAGLHLPGCFSRRGIYMDGRHPERLQSLRWLAERLTGEGSLMTLLSWIKPHVSVPTVGISPGAMRRLDFAAEQEGMPRAHFDSLTRLETPVVLFHWRILLECINFLKTHEVDVFRSMGKSHEASGSEEELTQQRHLELTIKTKDSGPSDRTVRISGSVFKVIDAVGEDEVVGEAPMRSSSPDLVVEKAPAKSSYLDLDSEVQREMVVDETPAKSSSLDLVSEIQSEMVSKRRPDESGEAPQRSISPIRVALGDTGKMAAFDSHFHFDRSRRHFDLSRMSSAQDLIQTNTGCQPKVKVNVVGGIMIFCDPESYPSPVPDIPGFYCAVGLHPKKANQWSPNLRQRLVERLIQPNVAFGEIGIDRSMPKGDWPLQETVFREILHLATPVRPLILHIRGPKGHPHSEEAYCAVFKILREMVSPQQRIVLHCFTGTLATQLLFGTFFKNCYFSFSSTVGNLDTYQQEAVREVPSDRLLIETDSPYLKTQSFAKGNTPAFVGDNAEIVARLRGEPLEKVLRQTLENGNALFL